MYRQSYKATRLTLNRIDASSAMRLRDEVLSWNERFRPVQGLTLSLEDVKFKNTEVIFVQMPSGEKYRIEADIDRRFDRDFENYDDEGEYQIGTMRLFKDNTTNRRLDATVVDLER